MGLRSIKNGFKGIVNGINAQILPSKYSSCGLTDQGLKRKNNEDSFLIVEKNQNGCDVKKAGRMFAVADGMGGHAGGETASRMACRGLLDYYTGNHISSENPLERLEQVIKYTDKKILELSVQRAEHSGMGTTLSVLVMVNETAFIAHVGDSRIYRLRKDKFEQLTKDHTHAQELIEMGRLTEEEALTYHLRHVITQAVGTQKGYKDIFSRQEKIVPGDRFLICSDGLHDMVKNDDIKQIILDSSSPEAACKALLARALKNGGKDNVTVLAVFT